MPLRGDWQLHREGFTADTILRLFQRTVLNPAVSVPLWLYSTFSPKGKEWALTSPNTAKWLKVFAIWAIAHKTVRFLGKGVMNNWTNDTYDWSREIVVVTGGSDGIGACIVKLLSELKIQVVILDIQQPKFTLPPHVHYFKCDLASPAEIRSITTKMQHVGSPTILINNAGFARGNTILSTTETDLKLTFQINTLSHYHLAQAFLPAMIQSNHGMVVTVASLAAYVTSPGLVDYSASKAAALAFHEGLQAELATILKAPRVRSVVICQGYTRTALFEGFHQGDFINYPLYPETVAEEIVGAVLRGQSDRILLPRANSYIANLRGWPDFLQGHARKGLKKMMKTWRGRQVAQPSEAGSNDGRPAKNGKELEASAVLL